MSFSRARSPVMSEAFPWKRRHAAGIALGLCMVSASLCADDAPVLFSDDFATLRPGWGAASQAVAVEGNRLILNLPPNVIRRCLYWAADFADLDLRVRVAQIKGNAGQAGGVIFWAADIDNFYMARVAAGGQFSVGRRMHGRWLAPVLPRVREEVRKGVGEVNELRVVTSGCSATVYVNDRQVVALAGFPPGGRSRIGVYAESGVAPASWVFSALIARKGPAAQEAKVPREDAPLFADDFAALDPGWGQPDEIVSAKNGKLIITPQPNRLHHIFCQAALWENADIAVKVAQIDGAPDRPAGIIFWAFDHDNYYAAILQPDGHFLVVRRVGGKWLRPVATKLSNEAHAGDGQPHRIRVVTSGKTATVFVDARKVATLKGFPPVGGGMIGLLAESGCTPCTWAFSKLIVAAGPAPEARASSDGGLLLEDDFSTLDPAWGQSGDVASVRDNKLLMNVPPNTICAKLHQASLYADADVRVKVALAAGGAGRYAGIVFWAADYRNYYAALLDSGGDLFVGRRVNDRWLNPVSMKFRPELVEGLGRANQLRVVTSGMSATIYANDRQLAAFRGFPPEGASMVGLQAAAGRDPYTWAFQEFSVRKVPAPPVAPGRPDEGLLLSDDFSTLDPAWGEANEVKNVAGNKLRMNPWPETAYRSLYQGRLFGDADIRVKIVATKGRGLVPAGLLFWASDAAHFHAALLRSDGNFVVGRYTEDKWQAMVPLQVRAEALRGLGDVNEIRVVTRGNSATAFINNKPMGTFQGSPPAGGSMIGLWAQSEEDVAYGWEFSDLVVRKPP